MGRFITMTTIELASDEAAVVIKADGSAELLIPQDVDGAASPATMTGALCVWAATQPDIRERFEALLELCEDDEPTEPKE